MALPIMTTAEDLAKIVAYLKTKATGAATDEIGAAIGNRYVDARKLHAYLGWGLVSRESGRLKLTALGWQLAQASEQKEREVFGSILRSLPPYLSAIEWVFYQEYDEVTSVELAAHWLDYNADAIGARREERVKSMATCFFYICEAAGVGSCVVGRRGQPTRLQVNRESLGQFIGETGLSSRTPATDPDLGSDSKSVSPIAIDQPPTPADPPADTRSEPRPRVFISHGKNMELVEQIKTVLALAELTHEVAEEEETTAIPVPEKVLSAMRRCNAAVICVTADGSPSESDDTYSINKNVLIEIGAAFVLYDKRVVLVWDKRLAVPSNLQGLYRCEFDGDELSWSAGTKLMKAVSTFKSST